MTDDCASGQRRAVDDPAQAGMGVDKGVAIAGNGKMVLTGPNLDQDDIAQPRRASLRFKPQLSGNVADAGHIAGAQIIIDRQNALSACPTQRFGQHTHTIEARFRIPPAQSKTTPHQALRPPRESGSLPRESGSRRHAPSP